MIKRRLLFVASLTFAFSFVGKTDEIYAAEFRNLMQQQTQVTSYSEATLFNDKDSAIEYINEQLMNRSERIILRLSESLYKTSTAADVFGDILDNTPGYYDTKMVNYSISDIEGGKKIIMTPTYAMKLGCQHRL